jgi:hypothetical protein
MTLKIDGGGKCTDSSVQTVNIKPLPTSKFNYSVAKVEAGPPKTISLRFNPDSLNYDAYQYSDVTDTVKVIVPNTKSPTVKFLYDSSVLRFSLKVTSKGCFTTDTLTVDLKNGMEELTKTSFLEAVKVYPNPTHGKVTIDLQSFNSQTIHVKWFNYQGREIVDFSKSLKLQSGVNRLEQDLSTDNLPSGIYFIRIENQSTQSKALLLKVILQ